MRFIDADELKKSFLEDTDKLKSLKVFFSGFVDHAQTADVIPAVHGLLEDDPDDPNRKIKDAINELSLWRETALRHCPKNVTNDTFAEAVTVAIDCLKEKIDTISE